MFANHSCMSQVLKRKESLLLKSRGLSFLTSERVFKYIVLFIKLYCTILTDKVGS